MKKICDSRLCNKEIDFNNCYSYIAMNGEKVFWCNEKCFKEHIGDIEEEEAKE